MTVVAAEKQSISITIRKSKTEHNRAYIYCILYACKKQHVCMSLTLCVDWLGGGAFLLKSASEMDSYGSVSSFRMVKRGLSHRFLESGASNLSTNASKLHKTNQMSGKVIHFDNNRHKGGCFSNPIQR